MLEKKHLLFPSTFLRNKKERAVLHRINRQKGSLTERHALGLRSHQKTDTRAG
jgi:hypothetical protein